MASPIPPILVEIQADIAGLKAGLEKAQQGVKGLDEQAKTATAGFGKMTSQLKTLGMAMGVTFAASTVVGFFKDSISSASDFNESMDKVSVVFKDNAKQVADWSKTSATAMGMNQQQALEAAGTYGALFQAMGTSRDKATEMSTAMVQLAADMASFNNASPEETLLALRSGLSGEAEPLKKFGVALTDAALKQKALSMHLVETTTGVLPPAIRQQAAYALILEQTQIQQGNYALTAKGVANTQRTLTAQLEDTKRSIGQGLLPVWQVTLTVLQKGVLPVLETLGNFLANNKEAVMAFTGVILVGAAAWGIYKAVVWASKLTQEALNAAMKRNAIGLVITAIGLLAAAFVVVWNKSETFRGAMVKLFQIIINGVGYLVGAIGKLLEAATHLPGVGDKFKGMATAVNKAANDVRKFSDGLDSLKNKKISVDFSTGAGGGANLPDFATPDTGGGGSGGGGGKSKTKTKKSPDAALLSFITSTQNKIADATKAYQDKVEALQAAHLEKMANARKAYKEAQVAAEKDYSDAIIAAEKDRTDTQLSIVQESMNRLRSAFAKGAEMTVVDMFSSLKDEGARSAEGLLQVMKDRLAKVRQLAVNASALAGAGFSQTFIEQVVSAGPDTGNALASAILSGDTEVAKELQSTFAALETTAAHGVDGLATSLYNRYGLATEDLRTAFSNAQTVYDTAVATANTKRTEALRKAQADFDEAVRVANQELSDGLAAANKALQDALDKIERAFTDKLNTIKATLASTRAEIAATFAMLAGASAMAAPVTSYSGAAAMEYAMQQGTQSAITNNIKIDANTNASATDIASATAFALTYGIPLSAARAM